MESTARRRTFPPRAHTPLWSKLFSNDAERSAIIHFWNIGCVRHTFCDPFCARDNDPSLKDSEGGMAGAGRGGGPAAVGAPRPVSEDAPGAARCGVAAAWPPPRLSGSPILPSQDGPIWACGVRRLRSPGPGTVAGWPLGCMWTKTVCHACMWGCAKAPPWREVGFHE